jgi:chromosomal replication initiator protein
MKAGDAEARRATIEAIQEAVADLFGLPVEELRRKSARGAVTLARQFAMYLAKFLTESSLPEIGRYFGGMHHTTVMHSIAKIHERRRIDPAINAMILKLLSTLRVE